MGNIARDGLKPDGLVVIEQRELPQRLFGLKLRDLSGIGKQMEKRLAAHGITTVRGVPLADNDMTAKDKARSARNEIVAPRIFAYHRPFSGEGWDRFFAAAGRALRYDRRREEYCVHLVMG